jgi:UDP-N-acetylmuramate dehydrogenase
VTGAAASMPAGTEKAMARLEPLGARAELGGSIGSRTTYRVGGAAAVFVTVTGPDDLARVADVLEVTGWPVLVVGRGSNLLVSDAGFPGLAVTLDQDRSSYGWVEVEGTNVRAGGAVALPALARQSVDAGLTGLEWAVGVPGSVGGGVRMNAGGHGSDMSRTLRAATIHDLRSGASRLTAVGDLDYAYRHSAVRADHVVTDADFALSAGAADAGRDTIRQIVRWRREHQPGGQNAGSVFTNPPGDSAGRLIEASGLKGRRLRTAMVSPKHANFIQADADGSADDVFGLMGLVQAEVEERTGVRLHPEVRLIGFPIEASSRASESDDEGGCPS